jgi:ABC-type transporter Mla subunit MlaD
MTRRALSIFVTILLAMAVRAQHRRDPLNDQEIEKIRDSAQLPEERLKLYVEFARARLAGVQQAQSDPKATNRTQQIHDALQDFLDIYDELNSNVDAFVDRGADLRKALKPVIEADTEFGSKLRAFKSQVSSDREAMKEYDFLLGSALEATDGAAKDHRQLLAEQEETFKHKKKQDGKESARHSE